MSLRLEKNGLVKNVPVGFSWTFLLFGWFVPLLRGDFKWFLIIIILSFVVGIPSFGIGAIALNIIFSFIYNRLYIQKLIENNWQPYDEISRNILVDAGIII